MAFLLFLMDTYACQQRLKTLSYNFLQLGKACENSGSGTCSKTGFYWWLGHVSIHGARLILAFFSVGLWVLVSMAFWAGWAALGCVNWKQCKWACKSGLGLRLSNSDDFNVESSNWRVWTQSLRYH